jgi:hypothetical protein
MQETDNHYKVITQIDSNKFIAICKHGTVHLVWGIVKLGFRMQDFPHMVHFINQNMAVAIGQETASGPLRLRHEGENSYILRILYVELHLTAPELLMLIELVNTALSHLELDFDALFEKDPDPLQMPVMRYVELSTISLN